MDGDLFEYDDDIEVIENPNDLGRYQSCDQFIQDLEYAINDNCHYSRLVINIKGDECKLSAISVGGGFLDRDNIQSFLQAQDEETTSAIFKEATNNGKTIESTHAYFIVLDPSKDNIQTPDIEDHYIPVPNAPFLAFAKPSIAVSQDGHTEMKWHIDDIKNIDLSGRGANLINILASQTTKTRTYALAAE